MNTTDSPVRVGPILRTRGLQMDYGLGEGLVRALHGVELELTPG